MSRLMCINYIQIFSRVKFSRLEINPQKRKNVVLYGMSVCVCMCCSEQVVVPGGQGLMAVREASLLQKCFQIIPREIRRYIQHVSTCMYMYML